MNTSTALIDYEAEIARQREALRSTLSKPASSNIGLKGKMFTFPDGTSTPGPISCIILAHNTYNSLYTSVYNPNAPTPPVCFAIGGDLNTLAPSPNSPKPQSSLCATCEKNQWGSASNGSKAKACKNHRRLLVACYHQTAADVAVYTITAAPTSIRSYDSYATKLEGNRLPIEVITEISFNPSQAFPQLQFACKGLHNEVPAMLQLQQQHLELINREPKLEREAF